MVAAAAAGSALNQIAGFVVSVSFYSAISAAVSAGSQESWRTAH